MLAWTLDNEILLSAARSVGFTIPAEGAIHLHFDAVPSCSAFIFANNEKDVIIVDSSLLRNLGGIVLRQWEGFGQRLLKRVGKLFATDPAMLSANKVQLRCTSFRKMLKGISLGDIKADYRRVWLLYALLEDYFA